MMKKIKFVLLFELLFLSSCIQAQNSQCNDSETNKSLSSENIEKGITFPKNGYKVRWLRFNRGSSVAEYICRIKKFKDSDSIYYMEYVYPELRPYCKTFCFIDSRGAKVISEAMNNLNKKDRIKWIQGYLDYTNVKEINHFHRYNKTWTYFKPRVDERDYSMNFTLASAIYAYKKDREKDSKWRNLTPTQWMLLFQTTKSILPMIGGDGTDNNDWLDGAWFHDHKQKM